MNEQKTLIQQEIEGSSVKNLARRDVNINKDKKKYGI